MRLFKTLLSCLCMPLSLAAEWVSPISAEAQENMPAPLLPFPREVKADYQTQLPLNLSVAKWIDEGLAEKIGKEGYILKIQAAGITLIATTKAGLFYAEQTLAQLKAADYLFPCEIVDYPAFPLRGFMHDTGRNFQTVESLKEQLDLMAKLKVNCFHWHLTDHPAWRIECKKYPILNDPSKRRVNRDEHSTYSYEQIREVFAYAKERHILIIPEIDMPGHSTYFDTCFGFKMHSEQGMDILEELLAEFFAEIPAEICPILHFGADEVRIPNAKEFVARMSKFIKDHDRTPMQWAGPHDLPVADGNIAHHWGDENTADILDPKKEPSHYVDATAGYVNAFEPAPLVRRLFYRQPCGSVGNASDNKALGPLLCLWPDARVDDKAKIPRHNPQWPAIMAMAERGWLGCEKDGTADALTIAPLTSESLRAFALFEARMCELAALPPFEQVDFPYWQQTNFSWGLYEPVNSKDADSIRDNILQGKVKAIRQVAGGSLVLLARAAKTGIYPKAKPGQTAFAEMTLNSKEGGTIYAIIGFDSPARSTRRCSGVPAEGQWSQCGTRVWLNGEEQSNPQVLKLAGQRRYEGHTWFKEPNELPFEDEEFWWLREPVKFELKPGVNKLIIEQPFQGAYQNWGINFIPVKKQGTRWVADESVTQKAGTSK